MTDQSQFDDRAITPATRPWKGGFVAALVLGLILGASLGAISFDLRAGEAARAAL